MALKVHQCGRAFLPHYDASGVSVYLSCILTKAKKRKEKKEKELYYVHEMISFH